MEVRRQSPLPQTQVNPWRWERLQWVRAQKPQMAWELQLSPASE